MNDISSYSMNGHNLVQAVRGPIMLIALGSLVAMDYFGVYGFGRTWPVLIILFGVLKLLEKVVARPVVQDAGPSGGSAI
jgi:fatty acid desaturase